MNIYAHIHTQVCWDCGVSTEATCLFAEIVDDLPQ